MIKNKTDSINDKESYDYSRRVEYAYISFLKSLPVEPVTIRHSEEEEDKRRHFDVIWTTSDGEVWFDDVKTVPTVRHRKGMRTNYSLSNATYEYVKSIAGSGLVSRYRLVLERYDDAGNVLPGYVRVRWSEVLEKASCCMTRMSKIDDDGEIEYYWLFSLSGAKASGVGIETVTSDIPEANS